MKKHYPCISCLHLNIKRLLLPLLICGIVTLTFLLFISLKQHDYTWIAQKTVSKDNDLHVFAVQKNKSQITASQTVLEAEQTGKQVHTSLDTPQYKYIISEPNKCQKSKPFLVLLIAVQAWQTGAREAIRQTWGKENFLPGVKVLRLFLLGKEAKTDNDIEKRIVAERKRYHDIIQQDFLDTYNNLTVKTLMGLHWVARYCSQASYIMKTDSDMFVNTEYLVYTLLKPAEPPRKNYFTGYLMRDYSPNRNQESKWYMSPELYPDERYPVFCSGTGYVFSGDLAKKILNVSAHIKLLHLEDVFIGLCLDKLWISPVPPPKESDFNHWKVYYTHCTYNQLVTSHQFEPHELITYWNNLQQNKHTCT